MRAWWSTATPSFSWFAPLRKSPALPPRHLREPCWTCATTCTTWRCGCTTRFHARISFERRSVCPTSHLRASIELVTISRLRAASRCVSPLLTSPSATTKLSRPPLITSHTRMPAGRCTTPHTHSIRLCLAFSRALGLSACPIPFPVQSHRDSLSALYTHPPSTCSRPLVETNLQLVTPFGCAAVTRSVPRTAARPSTRPPHHVVESSGKGVAALNRRHIPLRSPFQEGILLCTASQPLTPRRTVGPSCWFRRRPLVAYCLGPQPLGTSKRPKQTSTSEPCQAILDAKSVFPSTFRQTWPNLPPQLSQPHRPPVRLFSFAIPSLHQARPRCKFCSFTN